MHFGKERRSMILSAFDSVDNPILYVNCQHGPQLKDDPDLRKLIKQGKLIMYRSRPTPQDLGMASYTFLSRGK